MEKLLDNLNPSQRAAVEFCTGPSLVIAGAGSGKTRVLTYKIAYLLKQGLPPHYILALTFTNKAAREMKERIAEVAGKRAARGLWMGTFHSIFSRILRNEAEKLGYTSNYTIFDSSDSKNLIKTIIKEMNLDDKIYRPGPVHGVISKAKNSLITANVYANNEELLTYDKASKRPLIYEIYRQYQRRLKASNSMDFDDLLMNTNILFRDHPDVLEEYRNRFQYILVDEYQDTNFSQHLIVKQLADVHQRVCVVGDDAQSIYSFRGANIDNILKFKSNYPDTKVFKLEQNYRSTQNIVAAANSLIKKNSEQIFKNVFSERNEGEKIEVISAFSDFEEGIIVANKIATMRLEQQASYSDFAILYRTNAQSRIFEGSLRKVNIPYRIYGGLSFYQRKEIKDIISYFRMIVNPSDEVAFHRIINYPTRGIGNVTVRKITDAAHEHNVGLWEVISNLDRYKLSINAGTTRRIESFRAMIAEFIEQSTELSAFELGEIVIKKTGIAQETFTDMSPEGMSRTQNVQELINAMSEFVDMRKEQGEDEIYLVDFLSEAALLTDQDTDNEEGNDKVTLMTVHASKGLEFEHVFVVGMEDDLFPSSMTKSEVRGLEEERRLFYVAITRAKQTCIITFAKSRFKHGKTEAARQSPFLNDIDPQYLKTQTATFGGGMGREIDESAGGFWESMRQRERQRTKPTQPTFTPRRETVAPIRPHGTKPISQTSSNTTLSNEAKALQEGDIIEHERFGRGEVISIENQGSDRRAFVEFETAGRKQLLLKFAKFTII
ncbi:MAG TPA: UvrD-helicase domain-containing protein [Dysgonamonadaceae bacterium]|nr:UvrD-helicase domain-containing protein [Dysgonamonadaceae bacterium]